MFGSFLCEKLCEFIIRSDPSSRQRYDRPNLASNIIIESKNIAWIYSYIIWQMQRRTQLP